MNISKQDLETVNVVFSAACDGVMAQLMAMPADSKRQLIAALDGLAEQLHQSLPKPARCADAACDCQRSPSFEPAAAPAAPDAAPAAPAAVPAYVYGLPSAVMLSELVRRGVIGVG